MPRIVADLHGFEHYAWVTTAYLLTSTTVVPIAGKLSDLYGRRWFLLAARRFFVFASALCGLSQDMTQLIVFRGVQGIGAGMLMATVFTVISPCSRQLNAGQCRALQRGVRLRQRRRPTDGRLSDRQLSWRWVFYVNLPVGIVALTVLFLKFPNNAGRARRWSIDFLGTALMLTIVPLLLALSWGGHHIPGARRRSLACSPWRRHVRRLRVGGAPRERADHPVLVVREPRGVRLGHRSGRDGRLDVRHAAVPAAVHPGRDRDERHPERDRADADDVHDDRLEPAVRPDHRPHRPLQGRWPVRHDGDDHRPRPAERHGAGHGLPDRRAQHGHGRPGDGPTMPVFILASQNAVRMGQLGVVTSLTQFSRAIGSTLGVAVFGSLLVNRFGPSLQSALPPDVTRAIPADQLSQLQNPQVLLNPQAAESVRASLEALGPGGAALFDSVHTAIVASLVASLHELFLTSAGNIGGFGHCRGALSKGDSSSKDFCGASPAFDRGLLEGGCPASCAARQCC